MFFNKLKDKIIEKNNESKKNFLFINKFRNKSIVKRLQESALVLSKYPDRVPVIVDTSDTELKLDKNKFIIPDTLSVSELIYIIRKRIKISSSQGIFVFLENNTLLSGNDNIKNVYYKNKSNDGFLYLIYLPENVFG